MEEETNNRSCALTDRQMLLVESVGAAVGGVSALCCIFVLFVAVVFRKYRFSTQRIILYLMIAVLLYSLLQIFHLGDSFYSQTAYCVITGFLDQLISWFVIMAISCLTFDLLRKAIFLQLRTGKYEIVYVVLIFVFPIAFNWIPFIQHSYGLARAACWIKEVNEDCSKHIIGVAFRFALYWIPFYFILVGILVACIVVRAVVYRRKKAYKGKFNPSEQQFMEVLEKEIRHYQWYPVLFIIWNIFPVVVRTVEAANPGRPFYELRIAHVIFLGLQGALIAFAYALDYDTRKLLSKPRNIKAAFLSFFVKGRKIEEYNVIPDPGLTDSLNQSGGAAFDTNHIRP